jgi:hypothetical protein
MYKNLRELLSKILEESPRVVNMSLDDFAAEVAKRTGETPSKSTIKYNLEQMGITAAKGKKRTFVFKHNEAK